MQTVKISACFALDLLKCLVGSLNHKVKLHESGGEFGEKEFYQLVAVELHNFTADFSGEFT